MEEKKRERVSIFIDGSNWYHNLGHNKLYKYNKLKNTSNLRIVSMIPGDCKVAGCFNFSINLRGVL